MTARRAEAAPPPVPAGIRPTARRAVVRPRPAVRASRRTPIGARRPRSRPSSPGSGLRKSHLELAASDPAVLANFVELRRITSELADVSVALEAAEEAWLETEERAP